MERFVPTNRFLDNSYLDNIENILLCACQGDAIIGQWKKITL